jgi:transitional endoplasmic reticulum ATPase
LQILRIHTEDMPLADDVNLDQLVERTRGYTGADLEDLTRRAGLNALRDNLEATKVGMSYFEAALKETRASVTPEMEREYEEITEQLKRESPRGLRQIGFGAVTPA